MFSVISGHLFGRGGLLFFSDESSVFYSPCKLGSVSFSSIVKWTSWKKIFLCSLLANTPNQAETLLHSLERAAAGIGLHVNTHKTGYMCYNQTGDISTLDGTSLKLVDKFTYLGSSVSSAEKDIDTRLTKAWTAIERLSIKWISDLTDKMKRSFFQAAVVLILLYRCTTWTLTKRLKKKIDDNYTRMLIQKKNTALSLVELLAVRWVSCILRQPVLQKFWKYKYVPVLVSLFHGISTFMRF